MKQLQQSRDLYSPLRTKDSGSEKESSGNGYWDIEQYLTVTTYLVSNLHDIFLLERFIEPF